MSHKPMRLRGGIFSGGRHTRGAGYAKDGEKYIGIDNHDGEAWTEEFSSLEDCQKWLIEYH